MIVHLIWVIGSVPRNIWVERYLLYKSPCTTSINLTQVNKLTLTYNYLDLQPFYNYKLRWRRSTNQVVHHSWMLESFLNTFIFFTTFRAISDYTRWWLHLQITLLNLSNLLGCSHVSMDFFSSFFSKRKRDTHEVFWCEALMLRRKASFVTNGKSYFTSK